jgi:hypothetical protein
MLALARQNREFEGITCFDRLDGEKRKGKKNEERVHVIMRCQVNVRMRISFY